MLNHRQQFIKRTIDLGLAIAGLVLTGWIIALAALIARIETGKSGIYRQVRVGQHGRLFSILKIRTMREVFGVKTSVTTLSDPRITRWGRLMRKTKIDELPQLFNVLKGDMSFVGPRPDVPEIAGRLRREAPLVLSVRPGITGPATLLYRNEEELLDSQADFEWFNWAVVFPDKMRINSAYVENYQLRDDFKYLWQTFFGAGKIATSESLDIESGPRNQAA